MNIDARNYQAGYRFVLDGELEDVDMHASEIETDYRIRDAIVGSEQDEDRLASRKPLIPDDEFQNRDRITDDKEYREAVQAMNLERLAREDATAGKSLPWAVGSREGTMLDDALQVLFMVVGTLFIAFYFKTVLSPRTRYATRTILLFIPIVASVLFVLLMLWVDQPKTIRFHGEKVHLLGIANDVSMRVYGVCSPEITKYHQNKLKAAGIASPQAFAGRRDLWSIYSIGDNRFRVVGKLYGHQYVCDANLRPDGSINVISIFPVYQDTEDLADFQPIIDYFAKHSDQAIP